MIDDHTLYVRSDLSFHEDEDEDEKSGNDGRSHHPGGKRLLVTERADEPASLVGGGDREARRHVKFLKKKGNQSNV